MATRGLDPAEVMIALSIVVAAVVAVCSDADNDDDATVARFAESLRSRIPRMRKTNEGKTP